MKQTKPLQLTHHVLNWFIQGVKHGYPPCCIGEFIIHAVANTVHMRENRHFHGTGYIPCFGCNQKPKEQLLAEINSRRGPKVGPLNTVVPKRKNKKVG